jgi:hypothetical protein
MTPYVTYEEYEALPGLRSSALQRMAISPRHYQRPAPPRRTTSELFHLIHTLALEAHRLPLDYVLFDGRRAGKAWEDAQAMANGRHIIKPAELEAARLVADGMYEHAEARRLLEQEGTSEVTLTWNEDGLLCKARLDRLTRTETGWAIVDLKTYGTANPRLIASRAVAHGAHIQAAHYRSGLATVLGCPLDSIQCFLIVAEAQAPYDVAVVELTDGHALAIGAARRAELMAQIRTCTERDEWPGQCPQIVPLVLPAWADPSDGTDIMTDLEGM